MTFSRRSRRAENCRNGSTEERESVTMCLPGWPRSAAPLAAAARNSSGRPARSSGPSSANTNARSSASTFWPNCSAERREFLADLGEPLLPGRVERRARAHESEAIALGETARLGVQSACGGASVSLVDAGEQRFVEIDRAVFACKHGRDLALDRLEFVVGIGAREMEEHARDAIERGAGPLQRKDRVGEVGRPGIRLDRSDFLAPLPNRGFERRPEVLRAEGGEMRRAERAGPGSEQRIVGRAQA